MTSKSSEITSIMFGEDYRREIIVSRGYTENGTTTFESITNDETEFPSSALNMYLSSSSSDDIAAGTGVNSVRIEGLNSDWNRVSETIELDGMDSVNMASDLIRVNSLKAVTVGSNGGNIGEIRIGSGTNTSGVPEFIYRTIPLIDSSYVNRDLDCFFSVPKAYHCYILRALVTTTNAYPVEVQIWSQTVNEPAMLSFSGALSTDGDIKFNFFKVPEMTDVYISAKCGETGVSLHAQLEYCLSYSPGQ